MLYVRFASNDAVRNVTCRDDVCIIQFDGTEKMWEREDDPPAHQAHVQKH